MKKKCLSIIFSMIFFSSLVAHAEFAIELNGGNVTIEGNTEPETVVTVLAAKKGAVEGDMSSVYNMLDFYADDNGDYKETFTVFAEENKTEIEVFVKEGSGDIKSEVIVYVNEEALADFVNGLKEADSDKTGVKMKEFLNDNIDEMTYQGMNSSDYLLLSDKEREAAAKCFVNLSVDYESEDDIIEKFDKAVAIAFSNASDTIAFDDYIEKYKTIVVSDEIYAKLTSDDSFMTYCGEFVKRTDIIDSEEKLSNVILSAEAFYKINNCDNVNFDALLEENEELLGITDKYRSYKALNESKKAKASRLIINQLSDIPAYDAEYLADVIGKCVTEVNSLSESYGGGGGGRGSSSSGNSSAGFSLPVSKFENVNKTTSEPEKVVEEKFKFSDIQKGFWAETAIYDMYERGVIKGFEDNTFHPYDKLTREQLVTMVVSAFGFNEKGELAFEDVPTGTWYEDAVNKAYNGGIVLGISEKEFGIGRYITRQDMVVILKRAMEKSGKVLIKKREMTGFEDFSDISEYARESIEDLYCSGIVSGDGSNFRPLGNATRAEAAMMLYNILNGGEK